jgi:hypothetical protein
MPNPSWCSQFTTIYVNESPLTDATPPPLGDVERLADRPPEAVREVAPGVFSMAASFGKSMAQFAADGFQTVERSAYASRLNICQSCDQLSGYQCAACGCLVHAKAWLPHEACPRGKWGRE